MNGQYGDIHNQLALVAYLSEATRGHSQNTTSRRRRMVNAIHRWASESVAGGWRRLRVRAPNAAFQREDPATK